MRATEVQVVAPATAKVAACGRCTATALGVRIRCFRHACTVLARPALFSSQLFTQLYRPVIGAGSLVSLDGDKHRALRASVEPLFSRAVVAQRYRPIIAEAVTKTIDSCLRTTVPRVEMLGLLARRAAAASIVGIIGGALGDAPEIARLAALIIGFYDEPYEGVRAAHALRHYLDGVISGKSQYVRSDFVSRLMGSGNEGCTMSSREVVRLLRLLVPAAIETTSVALNVVLYALLYNGVELGQYAGDPVAVTERVDESLRWLAPVGWVVRTAVETTEMDGLDIVAGQAVYVSLADANVDPARYVDPVEFNPLRGARSGIAFGFGPHRCVGASLAREEISSTVLQLAARVPSLRLVNSPSKPMRGAVLGICSLDVTW